LDGSGKATQSAMLAQTLKERGFPVRELSFPCYGTKHAAMAQSYLNGDFGTDPEAVNPYAASLFFAIDRYGSFKQDWQQVYEDGGIIVSDRYTTSNAVHQGEKMPLDEYGKYCSWLFDLEYGLLELPRPDIVLFLETPTSLASKAIEGRENKDAARKTLDIHERDGSYLERCRKSGMIAALSLGWEIIKCSKDGEFLSREAIHEAIMEKVQKVL